MSNLIVFSNDKKNHYIQNKIFVYFVNYILKCLFGWVPIINFITYLQLLTSAQLRAVMVPQIDVV